MFKRNLIYRMGSWMECPPPGDLPNPGIEPTSLTSPEMVGGFFTTSTLGPRNKRSFPGTSLVVQWLRIHLATQGMWVRSPGGGTKIPHAVGPLSLN